MTSFHALRVKNQRLRRAFQPFQPSVSDPVFALFARRANFLRLVECPLLRIFTDPYGAQISSLRTGKRKLVSTCVGVMLGGLRVIGFQLRRDAATSIHWGTWRGPWHARKLGQSCDSDTSPRPPSPTPTSSLPRREFSSSFNVPHWSHFLIKMQNKSQGRAMERWGKELRRKGAARGSSI